MRVIQSFNVAPRPILGGYILKSGSGYRLDLKLCANKGDGVIGAETKRTLANCVKANSLACIPAKQPAKCVAEG